MPELNLRNKDGQQEMRADGTRLCMSQGCAEDGYYPAPKNRQELRSHIWFCLDHVRAYNSHWNYYDGLEGDALEAEIRRATTWERPSWKFGFGPAFTAEGSLKDPFSFFDGGSAVRLGRLRRRHRLSHLLRRDVHAANRLQPRFELQRVLQRNVRSVCRVNRCKCPLLD